MKLKRKKVTVVGLGKSGLAAARFLIRKGAEVRVTESSSRPEVLKRAALLKKLGAAVETGGHSESFVRGSELLITSPGVSKTSPPLQAAKRFRVPVISEIELASAFCPGTVVGVTGSNGKTTTAHLIHRIVSAAVRRAVLCGNVGFSFLDAMPKIRRGTTVVLELSSFQLEDCHRFRPKIAVLLNIGRNHLDRHKTLAAYAAAKARIFRNQSNTDFLVANFDDTLVRNLSRRAASRVIFFSKKPLREGVFLRDRALTVRIGGRETLRLDTRRFKLRGEHNLENILAAVAVGALLKVPSRVLRRVLDGFETLEHRLEPAGTVGGVHFVNDSKSTTTESTQAAILASPAPVVLIAGGRDKGARFKDLAPLLERHVKWAVLYGEARGKIAESWRPFRRFELEKDFERAVEKAVQRSRPGDTVLLSPMCTSFDQFSCFEERGEVFKNLVRTAGKERH
jgi:UDP-N-acetylmuramoylalanine--D-glutamate ligase